MCGCCMEAMLYDYNPSSEVIAQKVKLIAKLKKFEKRLQAGEELSPKQQGKYEDLKMENEELNMMNDFYHRLFHQYCKIGMKDVAGKILIPAQYKKLYPKWHYDSPCKPVVAVNNDNKCALVKPDGKGTVITPFIYDDISFMGEFPFYVLELCGKIGLADSQGKIINPCDLDSVENLSEDLCSVLKGDKIGFITPGGVYIEPKYDEMKDKRGLLYLRLGDKWGFLNNSGDFVEEDDNGHVSCNELIKYRPND